MASWRPTRRSDAFDVALAAAAALTAAASLWVGTDEALFGDAADWPRVAGIAVVAAIVVPLAVRRRFPFAVLLVATAAYVPFAVMGVPEGNVVPVAYFIALYTAGAYGGARRDLVRAIGVAVICGIVVWSLIVHADDYDGAVSLTLVNGLTAATNVFYLAAAWWLGELDRTRRDREATLEAQAVTLRAAQAERARQAVHDEQVRIARELHDVIAHHVSVMGVQAGAARRVLSRTPEAVPELLGHIEQSSRQAVAELHQMLGLLRRDDEGGGGTDPQPTLRGLDGLVDQMREAGLAVETDVADDATAGLPPSVDLSAYRIVQEALTNALKHAGPGTAATVAVARRPGSLEITVRDDGPGRPTGPSGASHPPGPTGPGGATGRIGSNGDGSAAGARGDGDTGHGLVGMRERVALLGGELKAGRRPTGGFEVRAWLPLRTRT